MQPMQVFDALNGGMINAIDVLGNRMRQAAAERDVREMIRLYNALVARSRVRVAEHNALANRFNELRDKYNALYDDYIELLEER